MEYIVELSDYWAQIKNNLKDVFIGGCLATDIDQTNNIAYLYGGLSLDKPNNKLYKFDLNSQKINVIATLPIIDRINHKMYLLDSSTLLIVSGTSIDYSNISSTIELYYYNLITHEIDVYNTKVPFRGQFSSTINKTACKLYLFGGFERNDFYEIDLSQRSVTQKYLDSIANRAGAVCEFITPNKIFIFSGFNRNENKSLCLNNYVIINTDDYSYIENELSEPFGRSFAKSCIVPNIKKILIFGGSINGMETSGSLYFYDYEKNVFNIAYLQALPGERVEPAMIYSERNNKVYIIGGLIPDGRMYKFHNSIMSLDLNQLSNDVWLGHP